MTKYLVILTIALCSGRAWCLEPFPTDILEQSFSIMVNADILSDIHYLPKAKANDKPKKEQHKTVASKEAKPQIKQKDAKKHESKEKVRLEKCSVGARNLLTVKDKNILIEIAVKNITDGSEKLRFSWKAIAEKFNAHLSADAEKKKGSSLQSSWMKMMICEADNYRQYAKRCLEKLGKNQEIITQLYE